MARTERESEIREEKWHTLWCCRDQQRACRMAQASAEKLEHTGPAEKERVALVPQKSNWQMCQSRLCQKEEEQSRQPKAPDREVRERVKMSESRTLAREKGIRAKARGGKGGLHSEERQVPRRKGEQARRAFLEQVEGNMSG